MIDEFLQVLRNWPATQNAASVQQITSPTSFSGARVWRVQAGDRRFALRLWQPRIVAADVLSIHRFQRRLAVRLPVIPPLEPTTAGSTFAESGGRLWELAAWMPGEADESSAPSVDRMRSALRTLAAIHNAEQESPGRFAATLRGTQESGRRGASPSMRRRQERMTRILQVELNEMTRTVSAISDASERELAGQAVNLIAALGPTLRHQAAVGCSLSLPLQLRLGDARREHFLFLDDEVTGVVDFGAVDVDSPAGDVARLIGGFAGADRERWASGLAAYEQLRPLTEDERQAALAFDSTGSAISAANWISWLFQDPAALAPSVDRAAAVGRLRQLVKRLRELAA